MSPSQQVSVVPLKEHMSLSLKKRTDQKVSIPLVLGSSIIMDTILNENNTGKFQFSNWIPERQHLPFR